MAKKLSASQLKKALTAATKEQLIQEIMELFVKFDVVQNHISLRMSPSDDGDVLEEYRMRVRKAMLPKSAFGEPRVMEARKQIGEYRKMALNQAGVIDLMLEFVECGVGFLKEMGDYKYSFYMSVQTMFGAALKLIGKENLQMEFVARCKQIIHNASNIGYGIGDEMAYDFNQFFRKPQK